MRPDFKHLLTERERHKWHDDDTKGEKRQQQKDESGDFEDWAPGGKISMRKTHLGKSRRTKTLNENLTPLTNFLRGATGRKWDDVYSEIAEACPNDSAVSGHIYQHLWQFVERNVVISEKGDVYTTHGYHSYTKYPITSSQSRPHFYVDPATGILMECPQKPAKVSWTKKEMAERAKYERRLENGNLAIKHGGIWYEAQLRPIPAPKLRNPDLTHATHWWEDQYFHEVYFHLTPTYKRDYVYAHRRNLTEQLERYYGDRVYCHALRQLNSVELRRNNLKNDT